MTTKPVFTRAILSLAISTSLAYTAVSASEKEIIIHEAIHDYTDDAVGSFKESSSRWIGGGYDVKIVLDEAYHDYQSTDVAAFETPERDFQQAEFAAFEEDFFNVPWELSVVD